MNKDREIAIKFSEMTPEQMLEKIVECERMPENNRVFSNQTTRFNYSDHNMSIDLKRYTEDPQHWVEMEVDRRGNDYGSPTWVLTHLCAMHYFGQFDDEQWLDILSRVRAFKFWKDLYEIEDQIGEIFGKVYKYRRDFHLEFWQGALADLNSELTREQVIRRVNSPENGDQYCEAMWELWQMLHPLDLKYRCQYTLMEYLAPCTM